MPEQPNADERVDPSAGDLPLEDPRWIPLIAEHKRLAARLASNHLAAEDLAKAMADGVVRSMRRWGDEHELAPPDFPPSRERKLVPPDYWVRQELVYTKTFGLTVRLRMPRGSANTSARRGWVVVGWVFFVWKPDIDRFWLRYELPPVPDQKLDAVAIDPPALAASPEPSPAPISKPTGPLKERIRAALTLRKSKPKPDDSYEDWAKRALPNDKPHSVATILSKDNVLLKGRSMWKEAGGTPAKPGRKPNA
jgi:hypothetical protein